VPIGPPGFEPPMIDALGQILKSTVRTGTILKNKAKFRRDINGGKCMQKGLQVRRIIGTAAVTFILLLTTSCRPVPADSVMLKDFQSNKAIFEKLATMATQDSLGCGLPNVGEAKCVASDRLAEYQKLLQSVRVTAISPYSKCKCFLLPSVRGQGQGSRGYAYSISGAELLLTQKIPPRRWANVFWPSS
jgi:hypothetical protein